MRLRKEVYPCRSPRFLFRQCRPHRAGDSEYLFSQCGGTTNPFPIRDPLVAAHDPRIRAVAILRRSIRASADTLHHSTRDVLLSDTAISIAPCCGAGVDAKLIGLRALPMPSGLSEIPESERLSGSWPTSSWAAIK